MPLYNAIDLSQYKSNIAQDMLTNLYVDNIVTGCESEEGTIQYYNTACPIMMKEAQFNLRSWASNNDKLTNLAAQDKVDDGNSIINVLGLQWATQTDTLSSHMQITYSCCHYIGHKP